MTVTASRPLETAVLDQRGQLDALEGEWDRLHEASPAATPFQSWPWLRAWAGAYLAGRALRVVTARDRGRLIGALPLVLEPGIGGGRLRFAGTGVSDHLDGLAEAGREEEVADAWARALRAMGGWALADLQEVRPGAAVWRLRERWSPQAAVPQSICLHRRVSGWDDFLAPMSRNSRSQVRRTLRDAAGAGVEAREVPPADLAAATDRLLAGHRDQWRDRGINEEHLTPRFETFLREAVTGLAARDGAAVIEFRDDGEALARTLLLVGGDYVGEYMYSASPEALRRWHVTALWVRAAVALAEERGVPTISFLRGEEPFKRRWAPELDVNHRLLLGRRRAVWAAESAYHAARARAVAYLRSDRAPGWLAAGAERLRAGARR